MTAPAALKPNVKVSFSIAKPPNAPLGHTRPPYPHEKNTTIQTRAFHSILLAAIGTALLALGMHALFLAPMAPNSPPVARDELSWHDRMIRSMWTSSEPTTSKPSGTELRGGGALLAGKLLILLAFPVRDSRLLTARALNVITLWTIVMLVANFCHTAVDDPVNFWRASMYSAICLLSLILIVV